MNQKSTLPASDDKKSSAAEPAPLLPKIDNVAKPSNVTTNKTTDKFYTPQKEPQQKPQTSNVGSKRVAYT